MWDINNGVYCGYQQEQLGGKPSLRYELAYVGDRHVLYTGPNGSGKTRRAALIALCRNLGWSICVVDTKGSLTTMTRELRKSHGCEEIILNPANLNNFGSTGHNPIDLLDPRSDDFIDDVMEHSETVIPIGDTKETHWPESGQDLVAAVEMYVKAVIKGTYADVRALIGQDDKSIRNMIGGKSFKYKDRNYPSMLDAAIALPKLAAMGHKAARFAEMTPDNKELHSIFSTTLTNTRFLDSPNLARDLSGSAIDFTMLKRKPCTVYLIVPPRRIKTYAKWLRLMLASIIQACMQDVKRAPVPVMLIIDEAYPILQGGFPILEDNYAQIREFGVKIWLMFQNLAQCHMLWGDKGFENFIGNAGIFQNFAPQEMLTAEYLSKRSGETTEWHASESGQRGFGGGSVSMGETGGMSEFARPLLLPHEIMDMDEGWTLAWSHKWKGTALSYLPYPSELKWLRDVVARDPAA